jgi:hypothetical protein
MDRRVLHTDAKERETVEGAVAIEARPMLAQVRRV